MNIRRRGNRATLWRAEWVPKGREGNPHGFKREQYLGGIPLDARDVPPDLAKSLTVAELAALRSRVLEPAIAAWRQSEHARQQREADALWRLEVALAHVDEARPRASKSWKERDAYRRLASAVASLPYESAAPPPPAATGLAKLEAALETLRSAALAVRAGQLGDAPATDVRSTRAYQLWSEISALVAPGVKDNLLHELQVRGWVKRRSTRS